MTVVMRAAARPSGPVLLRVAVVQGGAIVEERTLARREDVVVGPTERSTLIVPRGSVPEPIRLFEHSGGGYSLCCAPAMSGRINSSGRVIELPAGDARIPLRDGDRGRLVLGTTTLLFQLAPAPPAPAPAPLPPWLRAGLRDEIDWATTIIFAISFLIHFGFVGALWSDWVDPVIDDEARVADLVESLRSLPAPPVLTPDPEPSPAGSAQADAQARPPTETRSGEGVRGAGAPQRGSGRMSDARASALEGELRKLELAMVTALGGSGGATDAVLSGGDLPADLLDAAAASAAGVGRGPIGGLSLASGPGGVVRPGALRGAGLPGNIEQGAPAGAGSSAEVRRPIPNASISPPLITGDVPNAPRIIAGLRGGFRACYRRGLDVDPTMQGSVRVTAKIGPNGEVLSATPSAIVGLSSGVVSCVVGRIAGARFDAPVGGFAILVIPISFVRQ
jgi:hypothetical protein